MSVDKTIEELSGTLAQLSVLVEHINGQIMGVTSRINQTLDNFDQSVAGIATDASSLTGQVANTVSQIPNSWVFYLLFITLIIVLILLSILIIINLATRLHAIYALCFPSGNESGLSTPLPSNYSESRLIQNYDNSLQRFPKRGAHIVEIEAPRRDPIPYRIESGVNPSFQEGYPSSRSNIVSPKLTTFRVNTSSQTNTVEHKKGLQRPPTPAVEMVCDSFVYPTESQMLTSIYEENSSLLLEPASPGFLKPNNNTQPRRSLPTIECNSSGHIVVSRRISQKEENSNEESWIPIVLGDDSEISPPPPAPEDGPRAVAGLVDQTTFQHVPYSRRNPQSIPVVAQPVMSGQDSPPNRYPHQQPYLVSKTEPV
ncbi:hypothetical protein FO519_007877 [Halicephalobus sp. NKZ332]|nr:hypothetical protein FO519_007877 [Halicephalobus sp. NKZ332]